MKKAQGEFTPKKQMPIIDEVVMTVLSQHTSDVNSSRAFRGLRERFDTWEGVLHAPTDEVADSIRSGGIAQVKAARIQQILSEIEKREGRLDLARLSQLPDHEVNDYLCSLPGVGPKTAACVLLFSMNRPAFPVDTHVHRVTKRLGFIGEKTTAEKAQRLLEPRIPPELRYEMHMQLIRHGREVCKPGVPLCTDCVLLDLCEAGPRLLRAGQAR
ncbi:MAG: endonuclease III [Actinomycetota bacterium]|nr:endonuclease III [Actinomycetota bacterium]